MLEAQLAHGKKALLLIAQAEEQKASADNEINNMGSQTT
jgi:hypothetical protein